MFVHSIIAKYRQSCPTLSPWAAGHLTYREYRDRFSENGAGNFSDAFTFAVVRNPWDWHVSWFHYLKGDPDGRKSGHKLEGQLFQTMTFADYVRWMVDDRTPKSPQNYLARQMREWVIGDDEQIAVNRVLRQETLTADFSQMISDLNLKLKVSDRRINPSSRDAYRYYYDDKTAELVGAHHRDDIALFGYEF